jgi:putative transcriptional regulator
LSRRRYLLIVNRIKVLRAERDWTQADLAEKVGISRQAVISIEKYKYTPSLELAFLIAKVFGVEVTEVFTLEEEN